MTPHFRITIVGRPNVGKSTLFNRLIGKRRALVHDLPGVTRDRISTAATWSFARKKFEVEITDTGGIGGKTFTQEILNQVKAALKKTDIVLFVMDGDAGLTSLDREIYQQLKRSGDLDRVPVIGIVNKVDVESHESRISDFYSLKFSHLLSVSAEHDRGIEDLKQEIFERLKKNEAAPNANEQEAAAEDAPENVDLSKKTPSIAIVGRPNVGKSTLLNAIFGENRVITSPIAGTTVDSIDTWIHHGDETYRLIDTAGIRRKNKTEQGVEVLAVVQARKALQDADLAILVLDGKEGISDQDEKIGGLIEEAGCAVVLLVNKWDTQRRNQKFTKKLAAERIRGKMAFLRYAPIVFASAKENSGLNNLWDLIEDILTQRRLKISTHEFTEWVREESTVHNPMNAKFYLCHQTGRNPPTFVCHVNDPEKVHFSLKRHLVNAMRDKWGYMGNPIRLLFIEGSSKRPASPRK